MQESGEVGRWEVPGFIQGCGTLGGCKIIFLFLMLINRTKGGLMLIKGTKGMG